MANPVAYTTKETLLQTDRKGYAVELLVVHETAGGDPGDMNYLIGSGSKSVNWYIGRDGRIVCLDAQLGATAHAGVCKWGKYGPNDGWRNPQTGKVDWGWANLASEGIEVSGPNNGQPFMAAQVESLRSLVLWRMQERKLDVSRVVRHLDICWPSTRKNDPRGLDWSAFLASLAGPAPAGRTTIGGSADAEFACDDDFRGFYDAHGGLLVFGFATSDQYERADELGEACQFMNFENAIFKRKPSMPASWRLRPIQIEDAMVLFGKKAA